MNVVCCPAEIANCVCTLPDRHDGPHVCDCEGSWAFVNGDPHQVTIHALPGSAGVLRQRDFMHTVVPEHERTSP